MLYPEEGEHARTSISPVDKQQTAPLNPVECSGSGDDSDGAQYPHGMSSAADQSMGSSSPCVGTSAQLPLELFERIIDFLHSDKRALCACSLVCRSWYLCSQRQLCYRVVIRDRRDLNAIQGKAYHARNVILKFTRELEVNSIQSNILRRNALGAVPLVVGYHMPNVQRLKLQSCLYVPLLPVCPLSICRFRSLVHLQLVSFELSCFSILRSIISQLPKLLELELSHGTVSHSSAPISGYSGKTDCEIPQLRKLRLGHLGEELLSPLASWILLQETCRQVTTLFCQAEKIIDSSRIAADNQGITTENAGSASDERSLSMEVIVRAIGPSLTSLVYQQEYNSEHGTWVVRRHSVIHDNKAMLIQMIH